MRGITTDSSAADTAISTRPAPAWHGRVPCSEIPKATRTSGTAEPPSNSRGASTGGGICHPDAATTRPAIDAMMTGFRNGWVRIDRTDGRPLADSARIVKQIGVKTIIWSRMTGATIAASPTT